MSSDSDTPVEVRVLTTDDLPAVIAIERRLFPIPLSLEDFEFELSNPWSICLAAVDGKELVGYSICQRQEWFLLGVRHTVSPEHPRGGIARGLMIQRIAEAGNGLPLTLMVRVTNPDVRRQYEELGFRLVGVYPRYYPDNGEDAMIMLRKGDRVQATGHAR